MTTEEGEPIKIILLSVGFSIGLITILESLVSFIAEQGKEHSIRNEIGWHLAGLPA